MSAFFVCTHVCLYIIKVVTRYIFLSHQCLIDFTKRNKSWIIISAYIKCNVYTYFFLTFFTDTTLILSRNTRFGLPKMCRLVSVASGCWKQIITQTFIIIKNKDDEGEFGRMYMNIDTTKGCFYYPPPKKTGFHVAKSCTNHRAHLVLTASTSWLFSVLTAFHWLAVYNHMSSQSGYVPIGERGMTVNPNTRNKILSLDNAHRYSDIL